MAPEALVFLTRIAEVDPRSGIHPDWSVLAGVMGSVLAATAFAGSMAKQIESAYQSFGENVVEADMSEA